MTDRKYFLPYQVAWLKDQSKFKIWEKSRRIGATYVQAYEDVVDCVRGKGMDVWFSSADESAAKEYILYCAQWAKLLKIAAEDLGEVVLNKDDDVKALAIQFANGKRVHGLSSNPKAFRSKGGKVVLDEFAFHTDATALFKAAKPSITWGCPIRVLSTHNGKGNLYYRLVEQAKKHDSEWSLHTTPITLAVEQGLADKIAGRKLNKEERQAFIDGCREGLLEEEFQEEYMCIPVDAATAWITWDMLAQCAHPEAGVPEKYAGKNCYVGMDIGRRQDLTVIWVLEPVGDVLWAREVVRLRGAKFDEQEKELARVMKQYKVVRLCMDQTGMGEQMVERAQIKYGSKRVEGVLMTGPVKQDLATMIRQKMEDVQIRLPSDQRIAEAHHAIRKLVTSAGNPRFDADRNDAGHSDEFWAHALAIHAHSAGGLPIEIRSVGRRIGYRHEQEYIGDMGLSW